MAINAVESRQGARALAEIESDMLKAEAAIADAYKRLEEAERDRCAAIETINRHQTEFDTAVSGLRLRSAAGSRWRLEMGQPEEALMLQGESAGDDALVLQEEASSEDDGGEDARPEDDGAEDVRPDQRGAARTILSHHSGPISISEEFDRLKVLVKSVGNDSGEAPVTKEVRH
jgi:hypothetical protein